MSCSAQSHTEGGCWDPFSADGNSLHCLGEVYHRIRMVWVGSDLKVHLIPPSALCRDTFH